MNIYSGNSMPGTRHIDGWQNILTGEETGKKVGKKLKANADGIDPDEEGQDDGSLDYETEE